MNDLNSSPSENLNPPQQGLTEWVSDALFNIIEDPEVTEIFINGWKTIWFEKNGHTQLLEGGFSDPLKYRNFIHFLEKRAGFQINLDQPFNNSQWLGFRVHIIGPPLAPQGFHICLRRHPQSPWTLQSLLDLNWCDEPAIEKLKTLVQERENILIVGPTSTGKTSVLNALLHEIPAHQRAVIIEDTDEIQKPNSLSVKLLTRQDPQGLLKNFDQSELVKQSLRMRPDRLVVGEVRGNEAKDLLLALATGHSGGLSTLHAEGARQALLRLEMLVQMGAPQWSLQTIRHLIFLSLRYVILLHRQGAQRQLKGIYKLTSVEDTGLLIDQVYPLNRYV